MNNPPRVFPFQGEWKTYVDSIYKAFLDSFVRTDLQFRGWRVTAQRHPETLGKGFSFWHTISEAPDRKNRNEVDRIPDLRRCERILWIRWVIENADNQGFHWWENRRGQDTHVVIWAKDYDFAVILGKRNNYYVLKTAYAEIKPHRQHTFENELTAYWKAQKS